MAGRERALRIRTAESREDENVGHVNEGQRRHTRDDVLHEYGERFRIVDQL
jgi:hypothetical protein